MENEVRLIKKGLDKCEDDSYKAMEYLKCLDILPMSLEVLTKTHIGMAVNKFRRASNNPEVVSLCKSLVKKWKKLVSNNNGNLNNSTTANNSTTSSVNNNVSNYNNNNSNNNNNNSTSTSSNKLNQSQSESVSQQSTPVVTSSNSASSSSSTGIGSSKNYEKSSSNSSKAPIQTEVPPTTSEVRLKCRQLLTDALKKPLPKDIISKDYSFLEEDILAGRIEECIFQEFRATDMKYKNRFRSRVSNLGDMKNPYLRLNVLLGEISPERIAKMTAEEMASDELKKQREIYTKEAINDHQMSLTTGTKTSEIKCPACKKYNCTYNQVQTRSADEPMTTFCFCNECGKRWKFC